MRSASSPVDVLSRKQKCAVQSVRLPKHHRIREAGGPRRMGLRLSVPVSKAISGALGVTADSVSLSIHWKYGSCLSPAARRTVEVACFRSCRHSDRQQATSTVRRAAGERHEPYFQCIERETESAVTPRAPDIAFETGTDNLSPIRLGPPASRMR